MILRYWYDSRCQKEHPNVLAHVQAACQPDPQSQHVSRLYISTVTLGEIEFGHRVTRTPNATEQAKSWAFVHQIGLVPLDVTRHVGEYYGELKAWLFNNCFDKSLRTRAKRFRQLVDPISGEDLHVQENDVWIAAQAMTHNLVLVTHDSHGNFGKLLKAFSAKLDVQDWSI